MGRIEGYRDELRTLPRLASADFLTAHDPDPELVERLHQYAADERWRVREAVAMALQRLGDADLPRILGLVSAWADDSDPLVQRAAAAGICEPRLLRTTPARRCALITRAQLTETLRSLPDARRRTADVRVLRQALGYCADPDAQWL